MVVEKHSPRQIQQHFEMDAVRSIRQFFEKENNRHSGESVGKLVLVLTSPVVALASVETLQEMCRLMSSSHENR